MHLRAKLLTRELLDFVDKVNSLLTLLIATTLYRSLTGGAHHYPKGFDDLIDEVRIRVKLKKNDGSVTFRELSEGEQQLLTVLGLLQFTSAEESLFLLDEPDTHLNPRWSVEYIQHIRNFLMDDAGEQPNSHVLLATHNPIAVAELVKEQVQILKRDPETQAIRAFEPDTHPRGMGYAGVVTSELFDLNAALDTYTQDLLEEKRKLSSQADLGPDEMRRLGDLTQELDSYGFRYQVRDPEEAKRLRQILSEETSKEETVREQGDDEKAQRLVEDALSSKKNGGEHESSE